MKLKIKITSEYFYYCVLVLLLINNWWGDLQVFKEGYQIVKPLVLGSAVVFLFILTMKEKYISAELILIFLLIVIGMYTAYITGSKWMLYSMILISFARKIDIENAMKITYICMSAFLLISVSIFFIQYIFDMSSLAVSEDGLKYSMTFVGANEAARYWIFWFALFLYINAGKKILFFKKIMVLILTAFFYFFTRSDALLMIPAMAVLKCLEHQKLFRRIVMKFAGLSFGIIWLLNLIVLKFEHTHFFEIINNFATGRFRLGLQGIETYGYTIFGQSRAGFFEWINLKGYGSYRLVVDNAYYMIMIQYGVFYLLLITFFGVKAKKRLNYKSACCLVSYSVFALAENVILSPTAIFPVIIAVNASWKSNAEGADLLKNDKHIIRKCLE